MAVYIPIESQVQNLVYKKEIEHLYKISIFAKTLPTEIKNFQKLHEQNS